MQRLRVLLPSVRLDRWLGRQGDTIIDSHRVIGRVLLGVQTGVCSHVRSGSRVGIVGGRRLWRGVVSVGGGLRLINRIHGRWRLAYCVLVRGRGLVPPGLLGEFQIVGEMDVKVNSIHPNFGLHRCGGFGWRRFLVLCHGSYVWRQISRGLCTCNRWEPWFPSG